MEAIECLKWRIKGGLVDGVLASLQMDEDLMDEDEDLYGWEGDGRNEGKYISG